MLRTFCCLVLCLLFLAGCRDEQSGVKVRAPGVDVDVQKTDSGKAKVKVKVDD